MSSFSNTYTQVYDVDDLMNNSLVINNAFEFEPIHGNISVVALPSIPPDRYDLVRHYITNVVEIQYLLADPKSRDRLMLEAIQSSPSALDAACLLASVHRHALNHGTPGGDPESQRNFSLMRQNLIGRTHHTEGDAMASLHVISWVLFCGGRGGWQEFLHVACRYSDSILWHPEYQGPQDALMRCGETTRFIIKTAMWFDVLASATRVQTPYFLEVFRTLFDPNSAFIDGSSGPEELSMLTVMGCENHIVWALSEISNLACWKDSQKTRHALSTLELVKRGTRIEEYLMPPVKPPVFYSDLEQTRILTSQVFRASARVYLHSVLSGDSPSCKEIADGVTDTIDWLKQVPESSSRSVVRSVVFSICICACLTDIPWQQQFFLERLEAQRIESVGNCAEVINLIQQVWRNREPSNVESVSWRDVMRKTEMLLV